MAPLEKDFITVCRERVGADGDCVGLLSTEVFPLATDDAFVLAGAADCLSRAFCLSARVVVSRVFCAALSAIVSAQGMVAGGQRAGLCVDAPDFSQSFGSSVDVGGRTVLHTHIRPHAFVALGLPRTCALRQSDFHSWVGRIL